MRARVQPRPGQLPASLRRETELAHFSDFSRMKTVFCHADHSTDEVSSIFNVQFDRTGRFIISGADDGILKVWDRDTLTLQASLHGHFDYITDIDISKCNRFIASASKDAQIIIWDLKMGKIVKRISSHQSLINRTIFVTPRVSSGAHAGDTQINSAQYAQKTLSAVAPGSHLKENEDGPASTYVKDQYLLTCSDDGTVHLFDFSPFSRDLETASGQRNSSSQRQDYDEMRVRRSGRRSGAEPAGELAAAAGQENEDDVFIFEVALTPDDYRPGTRNKKLDTVAMSSAGIVIAGTSTGEIFCWKLNFQEITRRNNKQDCYKYLGQFKICKNAGVQFAEFSPTGDLLMTGSTDGSVKIWRLEIPHSKSAQQQELKTFSLGDSSRLLVTIDEKNGCEKINSISYYDDEGAVHFDYTHVKQPVSGKVGYNTAKAAVKELKFSKSQCDAIKWTVKGRYAIASITSQVEDPRNSGQNNNQDDFKEEVCRIKIWDTVNETFYDDLAWPSGHQLKKNSWVLAPHPIYEELLMTGSDGGTLILWNIEKKQILQKYSQYGVYSINGYVRDNPLDGKFSSDGKSFIVGNQLGTISLFSCESVEHQYDATRVQQFFMYDRARSTQNVFERIENRPQICGYNMIPHEAQPTKPLIGKFLSDEMKPKGEEGSKKLVSARGARSSAAAKAQQQNQLAEVAHEISPETKLEEKKAKAKAFEIKQLTARELGLMEEKYYRDQLNSCLQESFQPNVLEAEAAQLDAFPESSIDMPNGWPNDRERLESGYEDSFLVNVLTQSPAQRQGPNPATERSGANLQTPPPNQQQSQRQRAQASEQSRAVGVNQRGNRRRLVRRSDRALRDHPEIPGFDDSEGAIEDGYAHSPQSAYQSNEDDEDSASEASELDDSMEPARQRFNVRRTNLHEEARQHMQLQQTEARNRRQERHNRREARGSATNGRVAEVNDSNNDLDASVEQDEDMPIRRRGRGRPSNADRERMRQVQERQRHPNGSSLRRRVIIDDESQDVHMEDTSGPVTGGRQTRRRLQQNDSRNGPSTRRGAQASSSEPMSAQPASGRRNARRVIENSSNSRADDVEERKGPSEKTHNQIIRESGFFLSDKEETSAFNFDRSLALYPNDDSIEKRKKPMTTAELQQGTQPDEDYSLIENLDPEVLQNARRICSFCQRKDEPLVGPFCKYDEAGKLVGSPLFFHQDCVEYNQYAKFCIDKKKWVGIGKSLQNLVHREQFTCYRCQTKGATVQCTQCAKSFHGFRCAKMYTLQLSDEDDRSFYQCIFCRNTQNWEDRKSVVSEKAAAVNAADEEADANGLPHEKGYLDTISKIDKAHLLTDQDYTRQFADQNTRGATYNPQLNDFVYYFFQGHEHYMSQYSCHYFCGQLEQFPRHRFMPWHKHPKIKKREFVRCRVESVEILFPSQRSLNLIELYGETCTQVSQTAQIIQRVTLVVVDSQTSKQASSNPGNQIKFQVDIFPNSLPDFLILQATFNEKYERYVKALMSGIVDKTFKVFLKEQNTVKQMRIVADNCPFEPSLYPSSLWRNIKCVEVNPGRGGHGRVNEMPQHRSTRARGGTTQAAQAFNEDDCERVSFWDIQYGDSEEVSAIQKAMHVFVPEEKAKLVNTLKDFMEKKREYLECFIDRVPVEVAPDYRSIIPAEMYFNLIKDRISNGYYRSQEQLLSDIDLVSYNSKIYNGETHEISMNAKELCEIIRVSLKRAMFVKGDTLMQLQIAEAGKLTAPSRTRTALQQKTIMDEMRNSLQVVQQPLESSNGAAPDQVMMEPPSRQQTQAVMINTTATAGAAEPTTMTVRLTRNRGEHSQQHQSVAAQNEEQKNGKSGPGGEGDEENKDSIVRLNINGGGGSNKVSPITKTMAKTPDTKTLLEEKSSETKSAANEKSNRQKKSGAAAATSAGNKVSITAAQASSSDQQLQPQAQQVSAQSKQSNNMSRRRNRINAGLATAEELEEKTRTDVAATPATPIEASATENEEGASTMRMTRNRKRQRTE